MKKIVLLQMMILGILVSCTSMGNDPDKEVMKAFDLRMEGKVDDAKVLLDSILVIDPGNAMAHFELARLKEYMMIGGGGVKLEDVKTSIDQAVEKDPENVAFAYYKAITYFLDAYIAMQMGQGEVKDKVAIACEQFENVLKLKPDYHDARLTLVEIYGLLPPDMGGNPEKAAEYADMLEASEPYYGAKAKSILAPEDTDQVKYWEDLLEKDGKDARLFMETGKAHLYAEEPDKAEGYFTQAMELDPAYNILWLDLSRYHMYVVMQNQELMKTELPLAKAYAEKFLDSTPPPIVPLKAYSLGLISRFERFLGDQEASGKTMQEAKSLDPYFSRATGLPSMMNFIPPGEICYCYSSFFGPF